jgi:hypothetical protein
VVRKRRRLEEILLSEGLLDDRQLEVARAEQERTGHSLGRVLIDLGMVLESSLVEALAK